MHDTGLSLFQYHPAIVISDERAQEIIDKAMKSGSLKQKNVVGVITGLMGAGKTTLLYHLFGMEPPDLYTSTGIAERSFRGLLHHIVQRLSAGGWKRLSYEDIREFLAPLIRAGMKEENVDELAARLMRDFDNRPSSLLTTADDTKTELSPPTSFQAEKEKSLPTSSVQSNSPSVQKIAPLVKVAKVPATSQQDLILELVHMIDTGGQPELMEVMPSLIHNANLAIVLINLVHGLDKCPQINYHNEGVCYERQMSSRYTGRDIILKLVSTLQAKKSLNETFRLLIVATHRDCIINLEIAVIEYLNNELRNLLLPAFEEELILFEAPRKIAFVLDLKSPKRQDVSVLQLIISEIGKQGLGHTFDTPSSFFVFEQDLLKLAETVKRQILTLDECMKVGAQLQMTGEMVEAALVLFHRQNTLLYFRHVLPNHVFVNPQVPLDIVNGIVRISYQTLQGVPAKLVSLIKRGIVTEELLSNDKVVLPHFKKDIYEVQDAIKLFCHTFTLAPLQYTAYKEATLIDIKKKEYLMMCLKPAIPEKELLRYIPELSDIVPLVVKFSNGCVPLGCFGSTISCLLSQYKWEVVRKEYDAPKCLAHNIASLHDPDLLVNVVLVDFTQYIEIHIDSDLSSDDSSALICTQVRNKVFGAIKKVFIIMHLHKDNLTTAPAVVCSCQEPVKKHFAEFVNRMGKIFLCCEYSKSRNTPSQKQVVWMFDPQQKLAPKTPLQYYQAHMQREANPTYRLSEHYRWHQSHPSHQPQSLLTQYPSGEVYFPTFVSDPREPGSIPSPYCTLPSSPIVLPAATAPVPNLCHGLQLSHQTPFSQQTTTSQYPLNQTPFSQQTTTSQCPLNQTPFSQQTTTSQYPLNQTPFSQHTTTSQNPLNQTPFSQQTTTSQYPLNQTTFSQQLPNQTAFSQQPSTVSYRTSHPLASHTPAPAGPRRFDTPTLQELLKFPKHSGEFIDIVEQISTMYHKFGALLLKDTNGAITAGIIASAGGQTEVINTKILTQWLQKTGRTPQTWDTLVSVLDDTGLKDLANTIRENLR